MRRLLLILFVLVTLPSFILAQNTFRIMGKVTDNKGEPLIGANVYVKVLNIGAATDLEGKYSFEVSKDLANNRQVDLQVSFVGYKSRVVTIILTGNSIAQDFALTEDIFESEAIVVTGIASKTSKAAAEVSVSRVAASDLQQLNAYGGLSQLVAGKVAGVQLTTSSGNIGSGWRFYVRGGGGLNGDEQPTIYIDGVRMDNNEVIGYAVGGQGLSTLANLNPNDIEKIEFLKGPAAAAMYGTNGSNGVVLITTKTGKLIPGLGSGLSIDYRFNYGYNEKVYTFSKDDFITADDANRQYKVGPIREHLFSVAGGNSFLRYYASFENRQEDGIMNGISGDRNNMRLNLTAYPSDKLTLKLSAGYSLNNLMRPNNDNIIYGYIGNTMLRPVSWGWVAEYDIPKFSDIHKLNQFLGSGSATWTPIQDLEINLGIGVDQSNWNQTRFFPYGVNFAGLVTKGQKSIWQRDNKQFTYDFNAAYKFQLFDMINVRSTIGGQFFERTVRTTNIVGEEFTSTVITNLGAAGKIAGYGEYYLNERQGGLYTEHSFSYIDQYFLTLGIRKDYASSIGIEAPSITYPKASAAVRIDKYDFLPDFFNLLKFRIAYGESGVLPLSTDPIPLLWRAETGGYGAGAVLAGIGNATIQPERVKELEFGFDTEMFTDLSFEFTYYLQSAINSIVGKNNPPSTGQTASTSPFNVGSTKGSGFESLIQYSPIRSVDYNLQLSFILNYQKNEVQSLGGAQPIYDGFNINVIKEGMAKHQFYGYIGVGANYSATTSLYTSPIRSTDRVDLGTPIPNWTGSFTVNFKFLKNFNLYAFAEYAIGNKLFNYTKFFAARMGNSPTYNKYRKLLGLSELAVGVAPKDVTPLTPGTPEYKQAAVEFAKIDYTYTGGYVEDADYLIIREVSFSYDFTDLLREFDFTTYVKTLAVGVSVRNLARITKYSGADVEFNTTGARSLSRGVDFLTLQTPRTVNFWVRLGL